MSRTQTPRQIGHQEAEQLPPEKTRAWWLAGAVCGLLLGAGSTYAAVRGSLLGLEERLFYFVNFWPENLREVFLAATIVPESLWIAVAAVVVTFLLKMYRATWELAAATVAGYG